MMYLLLAKLVVVLHVGFVFFVLFGGFLFVSHRWLVWAHAPTILYAVIISIVGWDCPLTIVERWLLGLAGAPVYSGEFLPYYLWSHFGLTGSEVPVVTSFITVIILINAVAYRRFIESNATKQEK